MNSLLCFLLLAICAVSAHYRCRSPRVFESMLSEFVPKFNVSVPYGKFSYDGENYRTRTIEEVRYTNGTITGYDVIYYKLCKVMFIYDFKSKRCFRQKLDYPWKSAGIPENARYLGDAYLGNSAIRGGGLLVQTWTGNTTEHGGYNYMVTFTRHGCLPLGYVGYGKNFGVISASFYDITLGVANPNVFTPRKECFQQNQVLPEDLHYINVPVSSEHVRTTDKQNYRLVDTDENL